MAEEWFLASHLRKSAGVLKKCGCIATRINSFRERCYRRAFELRERHGLRRRIEDLEAIH